MSEPQNSYSWLPLIFISMKTPRHYVGFLTNQRTNLLTPSPLHAGKIHPFIKILVKLPHHHSTDTRFNLQDVRERMVPVRCNQCGHEWLFIMPN